MLLMNRKVTINILINDFNNDLFTYMKRIQVQNNVCHICFLKL